jgi:hypothetical protein
VLTPEGHDTPDTFTVAVQLGLNPGPGKPVAVHVVPEQLNPPELKTDKWGSKLSVAVTLDKLQLALIVNVI